MCLVPAAGERAAVAERPETGGHLPLLGERQGLDAGAVRQEIEGEGAAGHFLLEVMAGRHRAGGTEANMRAAAAAGALEEPRAAIRPRTDGQRRMRDREALAQGCEARRVLQRGHSSGRRAEQREAGGDLRHQVRRTLKTAAEHHAERAASGFRCEGFQPGNHRCPVPPALAEAAGQRAAGFGQRQRVLISEKIEHERPQARPARGLGQGPAGLGGDQERAALRDARRGQPAISTASA